MSQYAQVIGQHFWIPIPLTLLHWWWCLHAAYPLFLDARIRDGKSWVYLPAWWKSARRPLVYPLTLLLFSLTASSWATSIYFFFPWGFPWLAGLILAFGVLLYFVQRMWLCKRYSQQQDVYFQIFKRIANQYHREGKNFQEVDVRNRCAWEHQNALRRADRGGRFLRYLHLRSRDARLGVEPEIQEEDY